MKSNDSDFFENRLISHKKKSESDLELLVNPNKNDSSQAYVLHNRYVEKTEDAFGLRMKKYRLSKTDKRRLKKWLKNK